MTAKIVVSAIQQVDKTTNKVDKTLFYPLFT
jgi:hypothetical protein